MNNENKIVTKYKKYCATRRAGDLSEYAQKQFKKCKVAMERNEKITQRQKKHVNDGAGTSDNFSSNRIDLNNIDDTIGIVVNNNYPSEQNMLCDDMIEHSNIFSKRGNSADSEEVIKLQCGIMEDFFESNSADDYINEIPHTKINSLEDLLGTKNFLNPISTQINISQGELLLMILKFSVKNHLSHSAMSELFVLINTMFAEPVLHISRYELDKLFNSKNEVKFHSVCPTCSDYIGKLEDLDTNAYCQVCKKNIDLATPSCDNFFIIIDPSIALKEILETHGDYYDYVMNDRCYGKSHIKDIYDGKLYREFVKGLPENDKKNYVTTILNTDGAAPFKSSTFSVWPIYLMINEIPVSDRFNNLITCGLWFNDKKPNMGVFLDPLVDIINDIGYSGIPVSIKQQERQIKLYTLVCCVDSVARAPIQGIKQFNGRFGCNWCLHPGEWIGSMKYPILPKKIEERTAEDTEFYMRESVFDEKNESIYGIKYASALLNLKCFDIIHGFVPDYMHCCLAGVGKQITNYLVSPSDIEFYQPLLTKIKVPHQITRLTRPLSDKNYWKCREWENWILYFSTPLLSLRLDPKFIKYWTLFSESLYILLSTDISHNQLNKADAMLHEFVFLTEEYYKKEAMTYNIHLLLHLAKSVLNWGPLWAHSAFAFESGNQMNLQAIKCARGAILQILRYININRSILVLEKHILPTSSDIFRAYYNHTMSTKIKKSVRTSIATYFGKGIMIDEDLVNENLENEIILSENNKFYLRMVKDGCLFASCLKVNLRSDNSFAQLNDGHFIQIIKFIVDVEQCKDLTMCHKISTSNFRIATNCITLHEISTVSKRKTIISTKNIKTICVFIETENRRYLCPLPNMYFY